MDTILQSGAIDNLPVVELIDELSAFLEPLSIHLPEKQLRVVVELAVRGIIGAKSPVVTHMARALAREEETIWPMAKRLYRFIWNKRFSHRDLLKGLYGVAQHTVAAHTPSHLVVALDPVNFEKPYTEKLEGVSTVMKSTPPGPRAETAHLWLSSDDGHSGQSARAGGDVCQLVLLRDRGFCEREP